MTCKIARITCALIAMAMAGQAAQAANVRTWISGHGTDQTGCGAVSAPCRTLQFAHDMTIAGGEIDVLDPAGYGSVAITKGISIINDGVGVAGVLSQGSGNAISINAGSSDTIVLRGLTIEGSNTGNNGIFFTAGGNLTVERCSLQNFISNGIVWTAPSGTHKALITSTSVSKVLNNGIFYTPGSNSTATVTMHLDRIVTNGNSTGLMFQASPSENVTLSIANSTFAQNGDGLILAGAKLTTFLDLSEVTGNSGTNGSGIGVNVLGSVLYMGRSSITGHTTGVSVSTVAISHLYSFQNNQIKGNTTDVTGTIETVALR